MGTHLSIKELKIGTRIDMERDLQGGGRGPIYPPPLLHPVAFPTLDTIQSNSKFNQD